MTTARGLSTLTAGFILIGHVAIAGAQSVHVRNAEPGTRVEVVVNGAAAGTATVGDAREAKLAATVLDASRTEADARVSVEVCADVRRVLVAEPGRPTLPEQPGCTRTEVTGVYVLRRGSWLVVDMAASPPSVMLLQRPFGQPSRAWGRAPGGLMLFGGGSLATFSNVAAVACGNVEPCTDSGFDDGYTAGAAFWVTRFTAAEVAFVRPGKAVSSGSGTTQRFTSELDTHLVTIAGLGGLSAGPVRFYGKGGMNYHRATIAATQTIDDRTVTVDGISVTIAGGTQTNAFETKGWGWVFGGGTELWFNPHFAMYAEFGRAKLKGTAIEGEGSIDAWLTSYTIGGRLRIGG